MNYLELETVMRNELRKATDAEFAAFPEFSMRELVRAQEEAQQPIDVDLLPIPVRRRNGSRTGQRSERIGRTFRAARVQHDTMPRGEHQAGSHLAQAVGGAGHENST